MVGYIKFILFVGAVYGSIGGFVYYVEENRQPIYLGVER